MLNATSDTLEITLLGDYGFDHSYDDEGYLDVEDTFDEDDYDDFVDDEFLDDDFEGEDYDDYDEDLFDDEDDSEEDFEEILMMLAFHLERL